MSDDEREGVVYRTHGVFVAWCTQVMDRRLIREDLEIAGNTELIASDSQTFVIFEVDIRTWRSYFCYVFERSRPQRPTMKKFIQNFDGLLEEYEDLCDKGFVRYDNDDEEPSWLNSSVLLKYQLRFPIN